MEIYYTKISSKVNNEFIEKDIASFPNFIRQKLNAYKSERHKLHDYYGKKLLQFMLKEKQIQHTLFHLKTTERNRPFLNADFDFNISHSGDFIVLAFSHYARVGIDIELHRKIEPEYFKKYFSDNEWKKIFSDNNIYNNFFDFWSIKESAIKCNGGGLAVLSKTEIIDNKTIWCNGEKYHYRSLDFDNDYSFTVCSSIFFDNVSMREILF